MSLVVDIMSQKTKEEKLRSNSDFKVFDVVPVRSFNSSMAKAGLYLFLFFLIVVIAVFIFSYLG